MAMRIPAAHCEFVDGQHRKMDNAAREMNWATTQDRYYNDQSYNELGIFSPTDSTSHITYPNGDGTTNGKFIVLHYSGPTHNANNRAFVSDLPNWGQSYTKKIYAFSKTTNI